MLRIASLLFAALVFSQNATAQDPDVVGHPIGRDEIPWTIPPRVDVPMIEFASPVVPATLEKANVVIIHLRGRVKVKGVSTEGLTAEDFLKVGFSGADVIQSGLTLLQLNNLGITLTALTGLGITAGELPVNTPSTQAGIDAVNQAVVNAASARSLRLMQEQSRRVRTLPVADQAATVSALMAGWKQLFLTLGPAPSNEGHFGEEHNSIVAQASKEGFTPEVFARAQAYREELQKAINPDPAR